MHSPRRVLRRFCKMLLEISTSSYPWMVFEVKPNPSNSSMKVFNFGSPYIYALVAGRFWESMAQLGRGENWWYTMWFEAMVIHRLTEGDTFKVQRLRSSQWEQWTDLVLN